MSEIVGAGYLGPIPQHILWLKSLVSNHIPPQDLLKVLPGATALDRQPVRE